MEGFKKQLTSFLSSNINCKRFNNDSTMHGFKELYYAKKRFWKIFWFIIVAASIGVTAYQVAKSIQQYIEQPTVTTIQSLEEGKIFYPPFSICYKHWSFWVDLKKVANLDISKSTLYFGLSYMDKIFSQHTFDLNKSEENFNLLMQRNNWTYLSEFYLAISEDLPVTLSSKLLKKEKVFREVSYARFCYTLNGSYLHDIVKNSPLINVMFRPLKGKFLTLQIKKRPIPIFGKYLTQDEYYAYVKEDLEKINNYTAGLTQSDLDELYNPHILVPNLSLNPIVLNSDMDVYDIKFKATVHKWQNSHSVKCIKDKITNSADASCETLCYTNFFYKTCKLVPFYGLVRLKLDTPKMVCRQNIIFMDKGIHFKDIGKFTSQSIEQSLTNCQCDNDNDLVLVTFANETSPCIRQCTAGCEKWDFDLNVIEKMNRYSVNDETVIFVEYPSEDDVLVISEIDSQSWETFIANVGGLLGIWLGASIVSFIQMIYLCCFSMFDESNHEKVIIQNFDKEKPDKVNELKSLL